jgi:hypothetical protein
MLQIHLPNVQKNFPDTSASKWEMCTLVAAVEQQVKVAIPSLWAA